MSRFLALLASAMLAAPAFAQTPGACDPGTAQAFLDVSDVQASLFNDGGLFYGGSTTSRDGYLVPKVGGASPISAASLWIGGKVDGQVRVSYSRQSNRQMWPGPLNADGTLPNATDCSTFDRIWVVSTYDVAIYEETGVASSDLADWPVGLGAPAVDANGQPVVATSREQTLELAKGERPAISGTQTAFWVMNDVGNQHTDYQGNTRGAPLGVEVAVLASAVASDETALHLGTFYRYTVTNRNTQPITDAVLGFFVNPYKGDDYTGVDTTRGLGFSYSGYGAGAEREPYPAIGFDLLDGLGAFVMTRNDDYCTSSLSPSDVYGVLNGLWPDGSPIHENGLGCNTSGPVTRFAFAGDPVTESFWSMNNLDRNGASTAGGYFPFTIASPSFELAPGASRSFELAVLFAQGTDHLDSITELRAASDRVQAAYDNGSLFDTTPTTPLLASPTLINPVRTEVFTDSTVSFEWEPVPDAHFYRLELARTESFSDAIAVYVTNSAPEIRLPNDFVGNEPTTYRWRVRAESSTRQSPYSDLGEVTYYRYVKRPLLLADGSPAIVEIVGPGGIDPCGPLAQTRTGCDEVGGHQVIDTPNSTGLYSARVHDYEGTLTRAAPNDFEIRMGRPSFAMARSDSTKVYEVPFEVWDIGVVPPGEANDPSDDVQMMAFIHDAGARFYTDPPCPFNFNDVAPEVRVSDSITSYHVAPTYDVFAEYVRPLVAEHPSGCATLPNSQFPPYSITYRAPIRSFQFVDLTQDGVTTPEDLDGVVIRLYTNDPFIVAGEDMPRAGDLRLGAPYPNPTASSLTVPYTLARPSAVELAVVDVLGRRVLELVNARQLEGAHTATLDARTLAPGLYIIRLRAGEETRTTRITVVR